MSSEDRERDTPRQPIRLEEEGEDETSLLEADVMRFLAIIAFCLLVIFIPIVRGLSEQSEAPTPTAAPSPPPRAEPSPTQPPVVEPTSTAVPQPPTPTASPVLPATPPPPVVAVPTPRLLPTATRTPRPTRAPRPTSAPMPTAPPAPTTAPPSTVPDPEPAGTDEPAMWRLKFDSHEVMLKLLARESVRVTVYASSRLFEVQVREGPAFWFEPISRFEADDTTYRMGEDNLPAAIVSSFRRQFPDLASPTNLFYVEVSSVIRSNLEVFMSSNPPGTMIIGEDEEVRYDR